MIPESFFNECFFCKSIISYDDINNFCCNICPKSGGYYSYLVSRFYRVIHIRFLKEELSISIYDNQFLIDHLALPSNSFKPKSIKTLYVKCPLEINKLSPESLLKKIKTVMAFY